MGQIETYSMPDGKLKEDFKAVVNKSDLDVTPDTQIIDNCCDYEPNSTQQIETKCEQDEDSLCLLATTQELIEGLVQNSDKTNQLEVEKHKVLDVWNCPTQYSQSSTKYSTSLTSVCSEPQEQTVQKKEASDERKEKDINKKKLN